MLVSISTLNVFKFLLFTPIISTLSIQQSSSSDKSCISIKTSKPKLFASSDSLIICLLSKHAAINKIPSAPIDLDSIT